MQSKVSAIATTSVAILAILPCLFNTHNVVHAQSKSVAKPISDVFRDNPMNGARAPLHTAVARKSLSASSIAGITSKKIMSVDSRGNFNGDKPVTRYELAVVLDRFIHYIEEGRKPLNPTKVNAQITFPNNIPPSAKKSLKFLVVNDFIPLDSPLVVKTGTAFVSADELSNTISKVMIRLSDRSIAPMRDVP